MLVKPILTVIDEEFVTAVTFLSSPLILIISPAIYCLSNAAEPCSPSAVVAVTVETFAVTATVPNIFFVGSAYADLL